MSIEQLKQKLLTEKSEIEAQLAEIDGLMGETNYTIETAAELDERVKTKPKAPVIMTGIGVIDNNMDGLRLGTYINIAGEAGAGKTTLLLKILTNLSEGHKVLFFSFEMYEDRLMRFIKKLTSNYLSYKNLLIEQKHRNIDDIEKIITQQSKEGVRVFVIDSIMKLESRGEGINEKRSNISAVLAKLTQQLGIIIILINQISKGDLKEGRVDFKGSGDVAYDSDVNFFINIRRDNNGSVTGRMLSCAKNRDGSYFEGIIPDLLIHSYEIPYKE